MTAFAASVWWILRRSRVGLSSLLIGIVAFDLIQPVADLFHHHDGAAWIAGGIIITVAFCAIYLPVLFLCESRPRLALYELGALVALASVACLVYGKNWTPLWIYVSAAGGFVLTSGFGSRRASFGVFAITGCYLLFCWITHLDLGRFACTFAYASAGFVVSRSTLAPWRAAVSETG